jgi:hypothetical protein
MPVNHVDGTLFVSVLFYPFAAGKAALDAQAGWLAILPIIVSIPFGIAVNAGGRRIIYAGMDALMGTWPDNPSKWFQWLVEGPALLAYIVLPYAVFGAGLCATWFGSIWLVKHVL